MRDLLTPELAEHGANQHSAVGVRITHSSQDDTDRVLRRLKRDDPALARSVLAGEVSAHRAAVQAGIRKEQFTVPLDPVAMARAIRAQSTRRNLEPGEILRCVARLDAIKARGGGRTVERAHKVLRDGDARAAVESGEKSINAASKDVRPGRRLYRYEGRVD